MVRFIALAEEDSAFRTAGTTWLYFKLLSESINTTREDFFPETTDYWTVSERAEGFFRTSGSFDTLVEPVIWPKLLVLFMGDPTASTVQGATAAYLHDFKFGADEVSTAATGVKSFTTRIGTGIERDRQITGCVIESISLEAVAREEVSSTVSIIGSGDESLITAQTSSNVETGWALYTQPYLTFAGATVMTVGGTTDAAGAVTSGVDRLVTDPTIEAFRLTFTRGWDADHYVLGTRFLYDKTLSGMASVEGSMDFSFTSQDEHERFLAAVGTYQAGNQTPFSVQLKLVGALIASTYYYTINIVLPEVTFTASTASVSARDRIVQSVDFKGQYATTPDCAAWIMVTNIATAYTSLA